MARILECREEGKINDLSEISLALVGVSGVGKTTMMVKLAYELSSTEQGECDWVRIVQASHAWR